MKQFNRWSVIEDRGVSNRRRYWLCKCLCGVEKVLLATNVRRGLSKSCGCWNLEQIKKRSITHGQSKTRTYKIWTGIITRCFNKNRKVFKDYGGRGITVCDRWRRYENFLEDMGESPEGLGIDRIDNNGNYEPGNCRWTNQLTQANNARTNRLVYWDGKRQTMAQWCRELGLRYQLTIQRLNRDHWSIERAFEYKKLQEVA